MINLSKEESMKRIDLRKKKVISLKKQDARLDINARVSLVLDFSGSMDRLYRNGTVQDVIERIIPIALSFDDNGELDFWIFDDNFRRLDAITLDNYYGLAERLTDTYSFGSTNYAPVLQDIDKHYIDEEPMPITNYVIFITDGDNFDKSEAEGVITSMAKHPIFIQFVGIGDSDFKFLEKLDEMDGRYVDNANFFSVNDISSISDDELYKRLFTEYPNWLEYPEVKKMLDDYKHLHSIEPVRKRSLGTKILEFIIDILT